MCLIFHGVTSLPSVPVAIYASCEKMPKASIVCKRFYIPFRLLYFLLATREGSECAPIATKYRQYIANAPPWCKMDPFPIYRLSIYLHRKCGDESEAIDLSGERSHCQVSSGVNVPYREELGNTPYFAILRPGASPCVYCRILFRVFFFFFFLPSFLGSSIIRFGFLAGGGVCCVSPMFAARFLRERTCLSLQGISVVNVRGRNLERAPPQYPVPMDSRPSGSIWRAK